MKFMNITEVEALVDSQEVQIREHGKKKSGAEEFNCSLEFKQDGVKYVLFINVTCDIPSLSYGYGVAEDDSKAMSYWGYDNPHATEISVEDAKDSADSNIETMDWNGPCCQLYMDSQTTGYFLNTVIPIQPDWVRV